MLRNKNKYIGSACLLVMLTGYSAMATPHSPLNDQEVGAKYLAAESQFIETLANTNGEAFLQALLTLNTSPRDRADLWWGKPKLLTKVYSPQHMETLTQALTTEIQNYARGSANKAALISYQIFLASYGNARHWISDKVPALSADVLASIKQAFTDYFAIPDIYHTVNSDAKLVFETNRAIRNLKMSSIYMKDFVNFIPELLTAHENTHTQEDENKEYINKSLTAIPYMIFKVDTSEYGDWKHEMTMNKNIVENLQKLIQAYSTAAQPSKELEDAAMDSAKAIAICSSKYYDNKALRKATLPASLNIIERYRSKPDNLAYMATAKEFSYWKKCKVANVCGWEDASIAAVLKFNQQCPATGSIMDHVTIRAQTMTPSKFTRACNQVDEAYERTFKIIGTNKPVPGNMNDKLVITVFDSPHANETYGDILFDPGTSGIFFVGDAKTPSNIYSFKLPNNNNQIMNLRHEVGHYLTSRYVLADYRTLNRGDINWFIEGFANYIQYLNSYAYALEVGRKKHYTLNDIFSVKRGGNSNLVYKGGYLASRYFFGQEPESKAQPLMQTTYATPADEGQRLIKEMRTPGDLPLVIHHIQNLIPVYESTFDNWLESASVDRDPNTDECANGACSPTESVMNDGVPKTGIASSGEARYYALWVTPGLSSVVINTLGDQGGVNIYAKFGGWPSLVDYDGKETSAGANHELRVFPKTMITGAGSYLYITLYPQKSFRNLALEANAEKALFVNAR